MLFARVFASPETRTLGVEIQTFAAARQGGALTVVILYMIFQRYLIGGLRAGGVKG